jgi:hypothetical protein
MRNKEDGKSEGKRTEGAANNKIVELIYFWQTITRN